MLLHSKGIVFLSFKYGDNSIICKVFSEQRGLISLITNRKKGKRGLQINYLQPLNSISFVAYLSNKSTIHRLKEVSFNDSIPPLGEEISTNSLRFFLAEFLSKVIKEEEQNQALYSFLEQKVMMLSKGDNLRFFHLLLLRDLCAFLGLQPYLEEGLPFFDMIEGTSVSHKPTHSLFIEKDALNLFIRSQTELDRFTKKERKLFLDFLIQYYNAQLDGDLKNLKSKAVLDVIFD